MWDGLAVTGLKVEHRIEADAVVVTVSLACGQPAQSTVQVATIRLHDRESISIPELTNFGVDPIPIALDLAPPAAVVIVRSRGCVGAAGGLVVDRVNERPIQGFTHECLGFPAARPPVLGTAFPVVGAIGGRGRRIRSHLRRHTLSIRR